jgi:DNA/RNA-binding domain of Phe-tRNA-synthetase-like protein
MGLKPTQYRCASEALLRRFRKEGSLARINPLVDLCNAVSLAFAIAVAAFDIAKLAGLLEVRYATGHETYDSFSGETEAPAAGEVIFADREGKAHARRWTNRQSAASAVRAETASVVIIAEALHDSAQTDIKRLIETLTRELEAAWPATPTQAVLTRERPRFEFASSSGSFVTSGAPAHDEPPR